MEGRREMDRPSLAYLMSTRPLVSGGEEIRSNQGRAEVVYEQNLGNSRNDGATPRLFFDNNRLEQLVQTYLERRDGPSPSRFMEAWHRRSGQDWLEFCQWLSARCPSYYIHEVLSARIHTFPFTVEHIERGFFRPPNTSTEQILMACASLFARGGDSVPDYQVSGQYYLGPECVSTNTEETNYHGFDMDTVISSERIGIDYFPIQTSHGHFTVVNTNTGTTRVAVNRNLIDSLSARGGEIVPRDQVWGRYCTGSSTGPGGSSVAAQHTVISSERIGRDYFPIQRSHGHFIVVNTNTGTTRVAVNRNLIDSLPARGGEIVPRDQVWGRYCTGSSTGPGGSGVAAQHTVATNNEEFRLTIHSYIGGGSTDSELNQLEFQPPHVQDSSGKYITLVLAAFFAALSVSWEAYSVILQAVGPKYSPLAYGFVCVPVTLLGAGAIVALFFDKSPKSKAFIKYAMAVSIVTAVALAFFVLCSMIFLV